jgi:hypothetical protein
MEVGQGQIGAVAPKEKQNSSAIYHQAQPFPSKT